MMQPSSTQISESRRWAAVETRDQSAVGSFLFGVKTTGVYCHPGCSSRLPRRENVEFFESCAQAEENGYRPCKRCRPHASSPAELQARIVERICRRIETAEAPLRLDELATDAGLSPWHFQRVFKRIVGVTPKQYEIAHRAERFREGLSANASVTEAIYEAGFGSSRAAYEGAAEQLGMSPSVYRKGGAGLSIRYAFARCSLGIVLVARTERGLCAIELGDDEAALESSLVARFPRAAIDRAAAQDRELAEQVVSFVETPSHDLGLPLDIQGTAFQRRVWTALREIPLGSTVSYAEIARRLGMPRGARAVGQACAANPLAVAVPCHRVTRSDGEISSYRWGVERKHALLRQESVLADREDPTRD